MDSYRKGLVEYRGINHCTGEEIPIFRQSNIEYTFALPEEKGEIEQFVKIWITPKILEYKLIKTPVGISLEGQKTTGYKIMITGDIHYKIEYVVKERIQQVHMAYTSFPFSGYVTLPECFNASEQVLPSILVEDIYSEQLDCRNIYNNITLLFIADVY